MRNLPVFNDANLIVGAEGFSDAGVYRLRDDLFIVQTVDFFPPLVDDPFVFGQIAAANSLSDVYAMGAVPKTALNIVGFPDDQLDLSILGEILRGGAERVQAAGAVIVGGHTVRDTEIKYGLSCTGVVDSQRLMTNRAAKAGDALVLSKPLGTGFVTTAFKRQRCPEGALKAACESMTQLNAAGSAAAVDMQASAMTDITGFGLSGHAGEMALASHVTAVINVASLPLLPGAKELAAEGNQTRASKTNRSYSEPHMRIEGRPDRLSLEFVFDAQTSGGLLISIAAERAEALVERLRAAGCPAAAIIGEVRPREEAALVLKE